MGEDNLANELFLELRDRAQKELKHHLREAHEDCVLCQTGKPHLKYLGQSSLYAALMLATGAYIIADNKPILSIPCAAIMFYPVSVMLFMALENQAMKLRHAHLESGYDMYLRTANALTRIHARRRKELGVQLDCARMLLINFLDKMGEAKELWRGQNMMAVCLSSIIRLRDLADDLAAGQLANEMEKNIFSHKLQDLQQALRDNSIKRDLFEPWIAELYQELTLLEQILDRLQDMDLKHAAAESLGITNPELMEQALKDFISCFNPPTELAKEEV